MIQETLIQLRLKAKQFTPALQAADASAAAWVSLLALRMALNAHRFHHRRQQRERELDWTSLHGVAPAPYEASLRVERDEALNACLQALPAQYLQPIILHLQGVDYDGISTALQIPIGTAKTWVRRGLADLKGRLTRRGVSLSLLSLLRWWRAPLVVSHGHTATATHFAPRSGPATMGSCLRSLLPAVLTLSVLIPMAKAVAAGADSPPLPLVGAAAPRLLPVINPSKEASRDPLDAAFSSTLSNASLIETMAILQDRCGLRYLLGKGVDLRSQPDYRLSSTPGLHARIRDVIDTVSALADLHWTSSGSHVDFEKTAGPHTSLRTVMEIGNRLDQRTDELLRDAHSTIPVELLALLKRDPELKRLEQLHALAAAGGTGEAGAAIIEQMDDRLTAASMTLPDSAQGDPAKALTTLLAADPVYGDLSSRLGKLQRSSATQLSVPAAHGCLLILVPADTVPPGIAN